MVAFATVKEFFTVSRTNDQVAEVVNRIIKLPNDAKLYTNAPTQRQWVFLQSPS